MLNKGQGHESDNNKNEFYMRQGVRVGSTQILAIKTYIAFAIFMFLDHYHPILCIILCIVGKHEWKKEMLDVF